MSAAAPAAANAHDQTLPPGWVRTTLGEVSLINPGVDVSHLPATALVSFIPMAAVGAGTGRIDTANIRPLSEMKKGFTAFREGDVLFAKITPCMENGKFAVAHSLESGIGFGSTEFHVLRPEQGVNPYFILYYLLQRSFRQAARSAMGGSAGQLRVPASFLASAEFPLPPAEEQRRIVAAIEGYLTRLDAVVETLRQDRIKLRNARAALLRDAVEGRLTERWRATHPVSEDGEALLKRILAERRARWEAEQLEKMRARGQVPQDERWKQAYREPAGPDTSTLPALPPGWCWATVEQLIARSEYGTSIKCDYGAGGEPIVRIPNIIRGILDLKDLKYSLEPINLSTEEALQPGDVLLCRTNGSINLLGKSAVVRTDLKQKYGFASYLLRFRFLEKNIFPSWFHLFVSSEHGRSFIKDKAISSAGQHNISLSIIHSMPLPLPPLEEQRQIVAEVERRLSIIQQAEEAIERSLKRAEHLRQSILKRAFSGQLVPQDPSDEPASQLLERIRAERARREQQTQTTRNQRGARSPSRSQAQPIQSGQPTVSSERPAPIDPQQLARPSLWTAESNADSNAHQSEA
uniref:Type I restriction modification DNA specificity domain-containing protein n=1 Tax=Thermogemmatispora argillosa TaxID=2045280 RepID=A0A455SYI9_9CHLR|nr:hypothetical protein KTA_09490 [Thermogemmatispora argillosa]